MQGSAATITGFELSVSQLYICDELLMALQEIFYVIQNIHDSLNPTQGMELIEKEQKDKRPVGKLLRETP